MITYYTVLILGYTLGGEYLQSKILFPNAKACGDALTAYYEPIRAFDRESVAQCYRTDTMSTTILRPRARPQTMENDQ